MLKTFLSQQAGKLKLAVFVFVAGLIAFGRLSNASVPIVEDQAGLFSANAIFEANQVLQEIYQKTHPSKEIVVITVSTLPLGSNGLQVAENQFQKRAMNGVLIFIVKNPRKLEVVVGRATEQHFTPGQELRGMMLQKFQQGNYDAGLLTGLNFIKSQMIHSGKGGNAEGIQKPSSSYQRSWIWILILGGMILVALLLLRRRATNHTMAGNPGVSPSPYEGGYGGPVAPAGYGGVGGGWAKPVLGGIAGAMAGNWIYDQVTGRHEGSAGAASIPPGAMNDGNDAGQIGEAFGDSGSNDDWSGGGDTNDGGNDW